MKIGTLSTVCNLECGFIENDYYVYEHIRLDNNTCFYVGKGRGKRAWSKKRNPHHDRIVDKHGMDVNIVKDCLSEQEAFDLERKIINDYVFNKKYGINIIGYRTKDTKHFLTNSTLGGDGSFGMAHSDKWCKQHSIDMMGENNPMYGVNVWDYYDESRAEEVREKISITSSGENNPMYGVSPKDRMTPQKYKEWFESTSKRLKEQTRGKNPNAKKVSLYNENNEFIKEFNSRTECAEYLINEYGFQSSLDNVRSCIGQAVRKNKPYKQFIFK